MMRIKTTTLTDAAINTSRELIRNILKRAYDKYNFNMTADEYMEASIRGEMVLISQFNEHGDMVYVCVLSIKGRKLFGEICAGDDFVLDFKSLIDAIEKKAFELDCNSFAFYGSEGWTRKIAPLGFKTKPYMGRRLAYHRIFFDW